MNAAIHQLSHHIKVPNYNSSALTDSKIPDCQAAWEKDEQVGKAGAGTSTAAAVQLMQDAKAAWDSRDDKAQLMVAIEKFKDKEFIFIDSAGRSQKNRSDMNEAKRFLSGCQGIAISPSLPGARLPRNPPGPGGYWLNWRSQCTWNGRCH